MKQANFEQGRNQEVNLLSELIQVSPPEVLHPFVVSAPGFLLFIDPEPDIRIIKKWIIHAFLPFLKFFY